MYPYFKIYKFKNSPNSLTDEQIENLLYHVDDFAYLYSRDIDKKLKIVCTKCDIVDSISFDEEKIDDDCYSLKSKGNKFESRFRKCNLIYYYPIDEEIYDVYYFLKVIDRLKIILNGYKFSRIENTYYGNRAVFKKISPHS